jgi:ParB family chromosome partitioning protein
MTSNNKKNPALGRGLSALLSDSGASVGGTNTISIEKIQVNPFNPRTDFDQEALQELAESIKALGIIQPLTLRKVNVDVYQIISGERRFRAAKLAGLKEVPAYVRVANDQTMLEMALVENIQRENLNAIEIGLSYSRLIEECKLTQTELSQRISKSRSDIANHLRLLKLPANIQAAVRDNLITMGHARALLSLELEKEQLAAFNAILEKGLSVREVEQWNKNTAVKSTPVKTTSLSPKAQEISRMIGLSVNIQQGKNGAGKLSITYKNAQELEKILQKLKQG